MTDIFETDHALTVVLEMPGVDKENEVRVENDLLTIEGRIDFSKYQELQPVYTEYNIGNYARSFEISSKIKQDGISAELKDGVMTLVLPKRKQQKLGRSRLADLQKPQPHSCTLSGPNRC